MDDDEDNPGGGDRNDRPEAPAGDREEQAAEGQRPAASAAFKAHVARHRALMAEWYALLLRRADGPLPAAEEYRYWDLIAEGLHSMAGDMPVTVEGQLQNYAALAIKAAIAG